MSSPDPDIAAGLLLRQSIERKLEGSRERRGLLAAVRNTDLLQRLEAVETCRLNSYAPAWTSVEHPAGGRMEITLTEEVSRQAYLFGAFEEELSLYVLSVLKAGDVFVDAGAHYGYFSMLASALVGDAGRVVAFEPHPDTFEVLRRNTSKRANVEIVQKAVWNMPARLPFIAAPTAFSAFSSVMGIRLPDDAAAAEAETIRVDAISIDDHLKERGIRPDFLKLDVESAELQAIQGAERTLREHRPVVSIEVGDFDHLLAQGVAPSVDVLKSLAAMGYEFLELTADGPRPHLLREGTSYAYANIIAVPIS